MTDKKDEKNGWPKPLSEAAFYGIAGDFVRLVEPHTEADSAAILIQFLVAVGNVIGRGPHYKVEANRHGLNLFAVIVGASSKARKGTSWGHVHELLRSIDETWQTQTGLSSGEGLIHNVRDGADGSCDIADKRLMVVESEFASLLRAATRNGSTLSAIIRQAWDGGVMQVMTKQLPERASNAHISIVAHITHDELRKELNKTDSSNGFANRFLWGCVRRSKSLPDGGCVPNEALGECRNRIADAVRAAQSLGDYELRRNEEARKYWHSIYEVLSGDRHGSYASIVSRAEAQVMRLACIYALLDRANEVRLEHLKAAVAVWDYCEDSAQCIFGAGVSDPIAAKILHALKESSNGLSKTEVSRIFSNNRSAVQIGEALENLIKQGAARMDQSVTSGRPEQRWFAVR